MTDAPPAEVIEAIREFTELLEKAGDERWTVEPDDRRDMEYNNHIVLAEDSPRREHRWPGCRIAYMAHDGPKNQDEFDAKAELIAKMRNHLPLLLNAIAADPRGKADSPSLSPGLRREVVALKEVISAWEELQGRGHFITTARLTRAFIAGRSALSDNSSNGEDEELGEARAEDSAPHLSPISSGKAESQ